MISLIWSVEPGDGVGILLMKPLNSLTALLTLLTSSLAVTPPLPSAIVKVSTGESTVCSKRCNKQVSGTLESQVPLDGHRPYMVHAYMHGRVCLWVCPASVSTTPVIGRSV